MDEYIQEALHQEFLWLSTSPVSAGFFVKQKHRCFLAFTIDIWKQSQQKNTLLFVILSWVHSHIAPLILRAAQWLFNRII